MAMNKRVLLLLILLFGWVGMVNAQDDSRITIKGIVTDETTGEPVAFVNLGVLGTLAGVASDMDGNFELVLPEKYTTYTIRVSAVGYRPYEVKVRELQGNENVKIALSPVSYGIGVVDIYAESLVYKKMLKNAVEKIGKNYIARPYNYEGYFNYTILADGTVESSKEAIVLLYDRKGYERSDVEKAFRDINYRFTEVRRDREMRSVLDGLTYFDDIVTADIVRNTRNIMDIANSRDYKLKNKGRLLYENDSVQVIGYEVTNPTISTTGDAAVTKYSGEIYINLKDDAVLKNVVYVSAKDFNRLGRNLISVNGKKFSDVKMTFVTNYKKLNGVYFLSGINIQYSYKEGGKEIEGKMQYVTTRVVIDRPQTISGRMYYEDLTTHPKFWDNYTVYFREE